MGTYKSDITNAIYEGELSSHYDSHENVTQLYIGDALVQEVSGCLDSDEVEEYFNDYYPEIVEKEHYCNICCRETSFDEKNNCKVCGHPLSLEEDSRDTAINNMSKYLSHIGLSRETIENIQYGNFLDKPSTSIEVCFNSSSSFRLDERELLVQNADLVSQADGESRFILYSNSLSEILDELEDEDEYRDSDFTDFKLRLNTLIQAGADQYIFD